MTKEETLKLALEALESGVKTTANRISWMEYDSELIEKAITAIKEALAQPAQESMAKPTPEPTPEELEKIMLEVWQPVQPAQEPFDTHASPGQAFDTHSRNPVQEPVAWYNFLHYPECWDTAAYPTLHDAIHEALAWAGCSVCAPPAAPVQEQEQEPIGYLCENATGHKYFRWKKPSSVYKPIALYAKP